MDGDWRIATQLLPNEVLISAMVRTEDASPLSDLSPAEKRAIAGRILEQLRAEQARTIEATPVEPGKEGD
jgi:hypothetical protein